MFTFIVLIHLILILATKNTQTRVTRAKSEQEMAKY
jgi:hypothetical protein